MDGSRTIANLWRDAIAAAHPDPAYLHEVDGEWVGVTWAEAARTVDELANGLLALGVQKGEAFGLLARTSLEWALFDFALALVGAVGAPIYSSSSARDTHYVLEHSEAVGVLVEDDDQRAKVAGSGVGHVISFSELDALRERGRSYAVEHPARARRAGRFDRRGRPLHVHLHLGDDRAAEGLHDPAPQLLRDGAEGRRDGATASRSPAT